MSEAKEVPIARVIILYIYIYICIKGSHIPLGMDISYLYHAKATLTWDVRPCRDL